MKADPRRSPREPGLGAVAYEARGGREGQLHGCHGFLAEPWTGRLNGNCDPSCLFGGVPPGDGGLHSITSPQQGCTETGTATPKAQAPWTPQARGQHGHIQVTGG